MNVPASFSFASRTALLACKLILIITAFLSTASFAQEQTPVDVSIMSANPLTLYTVALGSGQDIQFPVFVFINPSDRSIDDIILTVDMPEGITFSSVKTDLGGTPCSFADNRVTCKLNYHASKSSGTLTDWYAHIQIYVKPTRTGTVTLTARITSNAPDPHLSNNTVSKTVTVTKSRKRVRFS